MVHHDVGKLLVERLLQTRLQRITCAAKGALGNHDCLCDGGACKSMER